MSNGFFEVFPKIKLPDEVKDSFFQVKINKIISNKEKTKLWIETRCETHIRPDFVFMAEKEIETQSFPGERIQVMLTGIPAPVVTEAKESKETKGSKSNYKKPAESTEGSTGEAEPQGKKQPKEKDPDVFYGRAFKETEITNISDIIPEMKDIIINGYVFKTDALPLKSGKVLLSLWITDFTDSIGCKLFMEEEDAAELEGKISKQYVKIKASSSVDKFDNELVLSFVRGIVKGVDNSQPRMDNAQEKRVELHLHTQMSDLDGIISVSDLMKRVKAFGHSAVAITDHGSVQSFPEASHSCGDIKVLYGMEAYLCDDTKPIAHVRGDDGNIPIDSEIVVFDLETTGLNASREEIIEIGAVKVSGGNIIDTFSAFVNPKKPIPYEIITLTGIDDSMVESAPFIEEVLPEFLAFVGDRPLCAHNADFDISCIMANCKRLGLSLKNSFLDTVPIARVLLPDTYRMKLDTVAKALKIPLDNHHRAVDDAGCTARIYNKFVTMLKEMGIEKLSDLSKLDTHSHIYVNKLYPAHCTVIAKNDLGRLNLYRLVSKSHLTFFHQYPRVPKSHLEESREGLLIGSGCGRGELFDAILSGKNDEELERIVEFYDFLEVNPVENHEHLIETGKYGIKTLDDIRAINDKIIELGEKYNIPVVATGDAHYLDPGDEIYRRIILSERKVPVKTSEKSMYFRTTEEMLEEFSYLGREKAKEIVITNSNMIANMCDRISPTRPDKCPPVIDESDVMLREICYRKAHEMYGENLPEIMVERLERELNSIISNGYAIMYIIAQKLVWKSNEDGYVVGSRGSVGSSLVATMAGISEVNPLPPHYICDSCHYNEFDSDTIKANPGRAGCDLPDKTCPKCGKPMSKHGFDIPFETFLGFKGDKEPDIDLNFSSEYLNKAHKYTEVIFGEGQTYRAGTVGTLQDKTAFAFARSYFSKHEIEKRKCEIERLSMGCVGTRRSTGQHPGGIIVLPMGEEMDSFTPVQHPANDVKTDIVTTHFDYHSIDSNLLKLDILGKDDPTQIRILEEITGIGVDDIPLDDKEVLSLFQNTKALGLSPSDIRGCDFGTLGIPEFGTDFAMGILRDTKPQCLMDLVRIAGLSHGTDVWQGNAKDLIADGKADISTAICTRDDIMLYLIGMGIEPERSFKIMENVRKGAVAKGKCKDWPEWKKDMEDHGVPDWYIWSCETIKYMFPKAHAAAYVMMAYRLGYFKVHYPLAFYAAYYSIKADGFDYKMMCFGPETLNHYLDEYEAKDKLSATEKNTLRDMKIVQEMYARGFEFTPIDLYNSEAFRYKIVDGKILPPFNSLEKMGEQAPEALCRAAKEAPFTSKADIKERGRLTQTNIEMMDSLGLLKGLSESNQLSLFDLM